MALRRARGGYPASARFSLTRSEMFSSAGCDECRQRLETSRGLIDAGAQLLRWLGKPIAPVHGEAEAFRAGRIPATERDKRDGRARQSEVIDRHLVAARVRLECRHSVRA